VQKSQNKPASRDEGVLIAEKYSESAEEVDLAEKVFTNSPNMLVLCLTVVGLVKIYTRFEKVTTLADNSLSFIALGYLVATVCSYLALRSGERVRRVRLSRVADYVFLASLALTAAVASFMTFTLAG